MSRWYRDSNYSTQLAKSFPLRKRKNISRPWTQEEKKVRLRQKNTVESNGCICDIVPSRTDKTFEDNIGLDVLDQTNRVWGEGFFR